MKDAQKLSKRGMTKRTQDIIFVSCALFYPLLMFAVFYVYVNFNSIMMAFQERDMYGNKVWVQFQNFAAYFKGMRTDGNIIKIAFINSMKKYLIGLIGLPITILFAYLLFKKCVGHKFIRAFIMIPQIVSGMVIALMFKKFLDNALPEIMEDIFKVENFPLLISNPETAFGTTVFYSIWISFALGVIVYCNAMNEIDNEVLESARLDGVDNMFYELWYIVLPLIFPSISTFIVTGFAAIFSDGGPILTFFADKAPAEVYNMGYYYSVQIMTNNEVTYGVLAAGGLIMTLVIAPLTYLIKRLLEKYGPEVD